MTTLSKPPIPKAPRRADALLIISRYINPMVKWVEKNELTAFYILWRDYPSSTFWLKHDLGFRLNSLFWFRTLEGAAKLRADWDVFHLKDLALPLDKKPEPTYDGGVIETDSTPPPPAPILPPRRDQSVAGFLKTTL
jgi:hypothetical protein